MKPPYEITSSILKLITSISEKIGEVNANLLNKPSPKLRKQNRIKTIHSSLKIEGNTLTEEQITALLENKTVIGPKKDILEVLNAIKLNNLVGNNQSYFTGHSLGGGLASVNSLATGRTAFTYNAAGLSYETRLKYIRGYNSVINATVVKGEILDKIQSQFGVRAEDSDYINYIEEESTFWQEFFNKRSLILNTYKAIRLHDMKAIIDILGCE